MNHTPKIQPADYKTAEPLDAITDYIHQVYSRKVTTQDQRRTIASKLNLTKEQVESKETRVKIADYLAKTQDNKYYHYVSKQELFWAMKDVMAGSEIDVQEKTRADALCDKLIVDLDKLAKDIWGEVEKEGRESVTKRTVEDRIKRKKPVSSQLEGNGNALADRPEPSSLTQNKNL